MKNKITVLLVLFLFANLHAQIPKLKDINNLKSSKVIIGLTGNQNLNTALKELITAHWNISEIEGAAPLKEALGKAQKNPELYVLYIGSATSRSFKHGPPNAKIKYRYISNGKFIGFSNGNKKPILKSFIPTYDNIVPNESIVHGVSYIQEVFRLMIDKNLKGGMKAIAEFKNQGPDLKNKTLLIPKGWMDTKLSEEQIKKNYTANFKVVSHQDWKNAILNGQKDAAYVILAPIPIGGNYLYQHHICDAETKKFYALIQPKAGVSINGINASKSNTGYINKKNIKKYNGVLSN